jgi:hypothetical protein
MYTWLFILSLYLHHTYVSYRCLSSLSSFSPLCLLSFLSLFLSLSLSSTPFVPAKLLQVTIYTVLCYMYMYRPMYLCPYCPPCIMHRTMHSTNKVISYDSTSLSQASFRPALNKAEEFLDYSGSGQSANGFF